ncbi:hypothetical protein [Leptospira kirschneri]|uniref:hypothetical protein n=1 Tax=Leptospira kirschneri TaxID=29507 RepID=UPI00356B1112
MILVLTHTLDYTADLVVNSLNQKQLSYERLNTDDNENVNKHISINYQSKNVEYSAIWFRRFLSPETFKNRSETVWLLEEYHSFIINFIVSKNCRIMSDPYCIDRAENKALQLIVARKLGFNIPKTLFTGDISEIKSFSEANDQSIIVKPISCNRTTMGSNEYQIFTNKVNKSDLIEIDSALPFPSIYQQFIDKEYDVRVTVIGNCAYSAFVESQENIETSVDWRKKRIPFKRYNLPKEIQNQCVALVKGFGLSFGAIDLVKSKNGEYYFLEINPNGQWGWIESDTELPLSEKIIDWLRGD